MKKNKQISKQNTFTDFLLYTTPDGKVKVEIFLRDENIWLPQDKIALLFGVQRPAITKHLKNIFESGELHENSVSSILEHTAGDGKKYSTKFYNLDAIISIGYRVNSRQATHFRIWATQVLKEYIIKGFAMNDERLKNPIPFSVRTILKSNWRVSEIFAAASGDFIRKSPIFTPSAALTMTRMKKSPDSFLLPCKTSSILPSAAKPRRKLFIKELGVKNKIWV